MRNLLQFENLTAYNAAKQGGLLGNPCVSLIKDTMGVAFDPYVDPFDGVCHLGDILYSDLTSSSTYNSAKTPIGICVYQGSKSQNKAPKWISVVNMSLLDPENGTIDTGNDPSTNPGAGIKWGANGTINTLTTASHPLATDPEAVTAENPFGWIEQLDTEKTTYANFYDYDNGTSGNSYPFVPGVYWSGSPLSAASGLAPYPFNEDGSLNQLFIANNPYLEGDTLTAAIIAAATATETTGAITNSSEAGHFPAVMACHRFTAGVNALANQWYMPSIGELEQSMGIITKVNDQLSLMNGHAVSIGVSTTTGAVDTTDTLGGGLWSSSEGSESYAWNLGTNYGGRNNGSRNYADPYLRVRAFLKFTPNS